MVPTRPPILTDLRLDPYPMPTMDSNTSAAGDRLVLVALPDPVLVLDPLGLVRDSNPAAERLFGRGTDSLRSVPLDRLITLPDNTGLGSLLRSGRLESAGRWAGREVFRRRAYTPFRRQTL